jgi:hypothetical protein
MNWKGYERKRLQPNLEYCRRICLDRHRNTTENLSQEIQYPDRA